MEKNLKERQSQARGVLEKKGGGLREEPPGLERGGDWGRRGEEGSSKDWLSLRGKHRELSHRNGQLESPGQSHFEEQEICFLLE